MGKFLGEGFASNVKRQLSTTFEVFGNIYSFFKELFTGDTASFEKSAGELGLSLLRLVATAIEQTFVQLPLFIGRMLVKVLSLLGSAVIKIITVQFSIIATGVDKIFGTNLAKKVDEASDFMSKSLIAAGDKINKGMEAASDAISKKTGELQDKYLRTAEDQAKIAKQATASAATTQVSSAIDTQKVVKDLDESLPPAETITNINDRLKSVNQVFQSVGEIPKSVAMATANIKTGGITPAINAVKKMVELANELDNALSDGNLNKLDVQTKLARVASGVGLGSNAKYTIQNKPVNITLNLQVTMNAEDLEKALIVRSKSVIRERLNWLSNNPTARGGPNIPETTTENLLPINTVGG